MIYNNRSEHVNYYIINAVPLITAELGWTVDEILVKVASSIHSII